MFVRQAKIKSATIKIVSEVPEFNTQSVTLRYQQKDNIEWIVRKGLTIMGIEDVIVRLIDETIFISRLAQ